MRLIVISCCLVFVLPAGLARSADDVIDPSLAKTGDAEGISWYDLQLLVVEGKGWSETKSPYDRLPARAESVVRDAVWGLSRHSAGLGARFVTDATSIHVRWTLTSDRLAMPHMPATGVSGVDLYVKADGGLWRWLAVGQPTKAPTNSVRLVNDIPPGKREFWLYLPLYNGVSSVEIGIPRDAGIAQAPARPGSHQKPIVFYGTSITQGGCASRPGMVHTAILGRQLGVPVINLGFSGNGKMELELAHLMSDVDAAAYVLDCLPNMTAAEVTERVEPFVQILRKAHAETPILLVEDRTYTNAFIVRSAQERNASSRAALRDAYQRLSTAGTKNIYYLPGDTLLGSDGEDTVDSSHPTDLGFMRHADAFREVLRPILQRLL